MKIKTPTEIEAMATAGKAVAHALDEMKKAIVPNQTTTLDLDEIAIETLAKHNCKPALVGYQPPFSDVPYKHATCISIDEEVIHGVPNKSRVIKNGSIVSLDLVGSYEGWLADSTITVIVGEVSKKAQQLVSVTREAMMHGIQAAKPGATLGDIGFAVQRLIERNKFSVVKELTGHGIGQKTHEDYDVLNFGRPGKGMVLEPGMTFCVEPMVASGSPKVTYRRGDPWTVVMADGQLAAHFEHTVAVTEDGVRILTVS